MPIPWHAIQGICKSHSNLRLRLSLAHILPTLQQPQQALSSHSTPQAPPEPLTFAQAVPSANQVLPFLLFLVNFILTDNWVSVWLHWLQRAHEDGLPGFPGAWQNWHTS